MCVLEEGVFLYRLSTPWVRLLGWEGFLLHAADVVFGHAEGPIGLPAQSASGFGVVRLLWPPGLWGVSVEFSAAHHGE